MFIPISVALGLVLATLDLRAGSIAPPTHPGILAMPEFGAAIGHRSSLSMLMQSPAVSSSPIASESPSSATPESSASPAPSDDSSRDEIESEALLRQRRRLQSIHRPLGISTWTALIATVFVGTLDAINQRTVFGSGLCATTNASGGRNGILGDYGCDSLGAMNEVGTFVTLGLYTATAIYALNMVSLDHHAGADHGASRVALRMHRGTVIIHLAAMILQPIFLILAANPGLVGLNASSTNPGSMQRVQDYQAVMRTLHVGVEFAAVGSLTTAMVLEL